MALLTTIAANIVADLNSIVKSACRHRTVGFYLDDSSRTEVDGESDAVKLGSCDEKEHYDNASE